MFRIRFETANAAFSGEPGAAGSEIARILLDLASKFDGQEIGIARGTIRDVNGNTIGHWQTT